MQVNSYIFQSPYSSQVQIGRLDTSKNTESTDDSGNSTQSKAVNKPLETTRDLKENQAKLDLVQSFLKTQTLDIYA
ncbi:MAG: hypothetical protein L3J10_01830 [Sulfurimonas sp.]|nr:hypothetical protein [Sulfurimonas sp.]